MHIVIILVLLFFYFSSQSFRKLINVSLASILLAGIFGTFVGSVFNPTAGLLVGIFTFLFSISMLFKALKFLTEVTAKGAEKGIVKYMEKRAKGEKHDNSVVDGGVEALKTVMNECVSEDNINKAKKSSKKLNTNQKHNVTNGADSVSVNFFDAIENSNFLALSNIKEALSDSEFYELINSEDELQDSPLHLAVRNDFPDILSWLISNGANQELNNYWDHTPLELAIKLKRNKCIERLNLYLAFNKPNTLAL
jgi:hypothetical protein